MGYCAIINVSKILRRYKLALYNGKSEIFKELVDGYVDYAIETITNRNIPDLRDGLKPVHRRILYSMAVNKAHKLQKSNRAVGNAMGYHPHGDASIYKSMASMVESTKKLNFPLLEGDGSFGNIYSNANPSHMRYTEVALGTNASKMLTDMSGIVMVPSETDEGLEPSVLPAEFPVSLVNGSTGLAVTLNSVLPSFNFWDVLDTLEKFINKGYLDEDDIIVPDLPSGGHIVNNRVELHKMMVKGKGRLRLYADVDIDGKFIYVNELPFGKTVEASRKRIEKLMKDGDPDFQKIVYVQDGISRSGPIMTISCASKVTVESTLNALYARGILRSSLTSNMVTTSAQKRNPEKIIPVFEGVFGIIEKWVEWRVGVIVKKYNEVLQGLRNQEKNLKFILELLRDEENKEEFLRIATKISKKEAEKFLYDIFPIIDKSNVSYIMSRQISQFNVHLYEEQLQGVLEEIESVLNYINNPESKILQDIADLRLEFKGKFTRKTRITNTDYRFSRLEDSDMVDDSDCYFQVTPTAIKKTQTKPISSGNVFVGKSNDVLVGFDSLGRLVRVFGEDIPYNSSVNLGTYLDASQIHGYSVPVLLPYEDFQEHELLIGYSDGSFSVLPISDIEPGRRKMKVIQSGIPMEDGVEVISAVFRDTSQNYIIFESDDYVILGDLNALRVKGREYKTKVNKSDEATFSTMKYITLEEINNRFGSMSLGYFTTVRKNV